MSVVVHKPKLYTIPSVVSKSGSYVFCAGCGLPFSSEETLTRHIEQENGPR